MPLADCTAGPLRVWFNPTVSEAPADSPRSRSRDSAHGRRSVPRRWFVGGIAVAVAVVGAGVLGLTMRSRSGDDAGPPTAAPPPVFVDETSTAGVEHSYDGDFEFFVGGGVAAFDCDDDGRSELYFAGGTEEAALYRNESQVGGSLRFTRQPSTATDLIAVTGAYPLDIDGDGRVDLAVLRRGGDVVLRGLGDCRFESANDSWGIVAGDDWTTAFERGVGGIQLPTDLGVRQLPRARRGHVR